MILLDSNIVIYAVNDLYSGLIDKLATATYSLSVITKLEALGYHNISAAEKKDLEVFVTSSPVYPLDEAIINTTILSRQKHKIAVPDAIIVAMAFVYKLELWMVNINDFKNIFGLKLHNPLQGGLIK